MDSDAALIVAEGPAGLTAAFELLDAHEPVRCVSGARANNEDDSMPTGTIAVDNIVAGRTDQRNIWDVSAAQENHEKKI